jgi:hypothetical protein
LRVERALQIFSMAGCALLLEDGGSVFYLRGAGDGLRWGGRLTRCSNSVNQKSGHAYQCGKRQNRDPHFSSLLLRLSSSLGLRGKPS